MTRVVARAPGRVNLIGDHTDYTGGLVLPMAVDLSTEVTLDRGGDRLRLVSADDPAPADVPVRCAHPSAVDPPWARYVAAASSMVPGAVGGTGTVRTTIPVGAGLASSAALTVATALAVGHPHGALSLARLCQEAERRASGVRCGIMDPLVSAAGVEDHALLLDCRSLTWDAVRLPAGLAVLVVHSGERRSLSFTAYGRRRAQCEAAERVIGPLRDADAAGVAAIADAEIRARARHVVSENARVTEFAAALAGGDVRAAGALMVDSHRSLRDDFGVSTVVLDELVERLVAQAGVHGARLTGAGFGGCVVALADQGVESTVGARSWSVHASRGASLLDAA
ncbi:MAG TPA: galactokinase family protein [Acidimicrobiales bacterium]|nr:galactokinase family protein [Acidimicrobiales bacterium]